MRARRVMPHVAQKKHSAIDGRTTRHAGYAVSLRIRKRVEEVFGWMKTVGGLRRTRDRGVERTGLAGYLVATAYSLSAWPTYHPNRRPSPCRPGDPPRTSRAPKGLPPGQINSVVRVYRPQQDIPGALNTVPAPQDCGRHPPKPILQQPVRVRSGQRTTQLRRIHVCC